MSKIFISYRRDDAGGYAHAVCSQLGQHFSKDRVFMDVDSIEPGVDFVGVIEKAVGECDVLLALIGKRWASVGEDGKSRLDDPQDFVPAGNLDGARTWHTSYSCAREQYDDAQHRDIARSS